MRLRGGGCPLLSASRCTGAHAAARSRRSASSGWRPDARSFASAFAPAPAPRVGMASGAWRGLSALWRRDSVGVKSEGCACVGAPHRMSGRRASWRPATCRRAPGRHQRWCQRCRSPSGCLRAQKSTGSLTIRCGLPERARKGWKCGARAEKDEGDQARYQLFMCDDSHVDDGRA